nr:unnamed protein product [Digitaria exilis]
MSARLPIGRVLPPSLTSPALKISYAWPKHRAAPNHPCSHPLPDVGRFSYSWPTSKSKPQHEGRIGHGNIAKLIETDPASSVDRRRNAVSTSGDRFPTGPSRWPTPFLDGLLRPQLVPLHLASQQGQEDDGVPCLELEEPVLTRSLSLDSSWRKITST